MSVHTGRSRPRVPLPRFLRSPCAPGVVLWHLPAALPWPGYFLGAHLLHHLLPRTFWNPLATPSVPFVCSCGARDPELRFTCRLCPPHPVYNSHVSAMSMAPCPCACCIWLSRKGLGCPVSHLAGGPWLGPCSGDPVGTGGCVLAPRPWP